MNDTPESEPTADAPPAPAHSGGWFADLHLAAAFLTRLPLPVAPCGPGGLAPAMAVFPLVGGAIGATAGLVFLAGFQVLPPLPAALLALAVATLLTGALHEDGLADFADGLGARGGREHRLEVMRDSRTGAFGVLALVFGIALRAACLAAAPSGWAGFGALVAAGALARAAFPAVMQALPPARADGLGAGAGVPDAGVAARAAVAALVLAVLGLGPMAALAALAASAAAAIVLGWLARRALGGFTGDVLGATAQLVEVAVLLAAAVAWR